MPDKGVVKAKHKNTIFRMNAKQFSIEKTEKFLQVSFVKNQRQKGCN